MWDLLPVNPGPNADHRTAGMSFGVLGTAALCRPANFVLLKTA
jgi:hypothetical protein